MSKMLVRAVVGVVAAAASLSSSLACGHWEAWLTDEEIAIAKAGGDVPWRSWQFLQPTLPDIPFESPIAIQEEIARDAIGVARLQLVVEATRPLDIALTTVLPPPHIEDVAGADAQEPTAPGDERSGLKRVEFACNGTMTVSPTLL